MATFRLYPDEVTHLNPLVEVGDYTAFCQGDVVYVASVVPAFTGEVVAGPPPQSNDLADLYYPSTRRGLLIKDSNEVFAWSDKFPATLTLTLTP